MRKIEKPKATTKPTSMAAKHAEPKWIEYGQPWATFARQKLNRPGTQIEMADDSEDGGMVYLIGEINMMGGICDDCRGFKAQDTVARYRVLVEIDGE